jgi:DNA-binding IscR family transcriptional regulator
VLKHVLATATGAYLQELDQLTLADLVRPEAPPQPRRRGLQEPGGRTAPV